MRQLFVCLAFFLLTVSSLFGQENNTQDTNTTEDQAAGMSQTLPEEETAGGLKASATIPLTEFNAPAAQAEVDTMKVSPESSKTGSRQKDTAGELQGK